MWPSDQYSPRVLVLRPTAYVGVLNILIPVNVGTLHVQCAATIAQTFGVEYILNKIRQLQEFRLFCDQYDIQRELQSEQLLVSLADCASLASLTLTNCRFTEKISKQFI